MTNQISIKLVRSRIGTKQAQKATLDSLGLKKIGQEVVKPNNEAVQGMIKKVAHLVETK